MRTPFPLITSMLMMSIGCTTPYQPRGFKGGYEDRPIGGDGAILVTFVGNGFTGLDDAKNMWHRRAAEICNGIHRYVLVGDLQTFVGGICKVEGVIRCVEDEPTARRAAPSSVE